LAEKKEDQARENVRHLHPKRSLPEQVEEKKTPGEMANLCVYLEKMV